MHAEPAARRKRVVVIGGGFGGLFAAKALRRSNLDVLVIDRTNHHLFQPLLYQVATAGLSPADIAQPIRRILRRQKNVTVWMASVVGIDLERQVVATDCGEAPFDYLIVAAGVRHSYFGHGAWEASAPGLKTLEDALRIREAILTAFEEAETCPEPNERTERLTFAIVGGGPTGVEMAGSIAELAKRALVRDFRTIDPAQAKVILLEAGNRLLASFPPKLGREAEKALRELGVDVRTDVRVEGFEGNRILTSQGEMQAAVRIWAAGVEAAVPPDWLPADRDGSGRIRVEPDSSLPGFPNVFVVGDLAAMKGIDGKQLPGVCQTAMQQGTFAAELIADWEATSFRPKREFRYRDKGNMATIGRRKAVAQIGSWEVSGGIAWLLWLSIHIWYLIGFESKLLVLIQWAWSYLTFERGARLISHEAPRARKVE